MIYESMFQPNDEVGPDHSKVVRTGAEGGAKAKTTSQSHQSSSDQSQTSKHKDSKLAKNAH